MARARIDISNRATPAFQFYPNDWLSSLKVACMTPEQEGAYIHLLCHDWANDGLPDDPAILAQLSRLGDKWDGATVVQNCFEKHPHKNGFITNKRLEIEREIQTNNRKQKSKSGIKSAKSRAYMSQRMLNGRSTDVQRNANSSSSSSSSSSTSSTNKKEPPISPKGGEDGFEKFWKAYPRKTGKGKAFESWNKIKPSQEVQAQILQAIAEHCKTEQWKKENGQYIPFPATWLNQRRWEDSTEIILPFVPRPKDSEWTI